MPSDLIKKITILRKHFEKLSQSKKYFYRFPCIILIIIYYTIDWITL